MTTASGNMVHFSGEVAERGSASYLDFVAGVRLFDARLVRPQVLQAYLRGAADFERRTGRKPTSLAEAHDIIDGQQVSRWYRRLMRTGQEMNWDGVIRSSEGYTEALGKELAAAESRGPGKLVLDPDFQYPAYFDRTEFHLQPGSYHGTPVSGYIYSSSPSWRSQERRTRPRSAALGPCQLLLGARTLASLAKCADFVPHELEARRFDQTP